MTTGRINQVSRVHTGKCAGFGGRRGPRRRRLSHDRTTSSSTTDVPSATFGCRPVGYPHAIVERTARKRDIQTLRAGRDVRSRPVEATAIASRPSADRPCPLCHATRAPKQTLGPVAGESRLGQGSIPCRPPPRRQVIFCRTRRRSPASVCHLPSFPNLHPLRETHSPIIGSFL